MGLLRCPGPTRRARIEGTAALATRTRRKPARRSARAPARRPAGGAPRKRPPPRRPKRQSSIRPLVEGAGSALRWTGAGIRSLPAEAWGLLVVLLGAVAWLGVYSSGAGPVGGAIDYIGSLIWGSLVVLTPLLLIATGVLMIAPSSREHVGRILAGIALCGLAAAAMVHLIRGNKPASTSIEKLQEVGGIAGALIASPLSGLVGVWVSWLLLLCLFGVGVMVITRTPVSTVGGWARAGAVGGWAFVKGLAAGALESDDDEDEEEDEDEDEESYDADYVEEDDAADPEASLPRLVPPPETPRQMAMPVGSGKTYKLPAMELLTTGDEREISERSIAEATKVLETTLEQFDVDASVTGYTAGPTVTRFEIELGSGVKVNRVLSLSNEIKYAMASGELRFLAPIPGRSAIGVEVPNRTRQLVTLGDLLRSKEARKDPHPMSIALGQDISGETVMAKLTEMPHVLIAGATNSGKSSCINSMITSILMRARPDQVRMILIDPKRVELTHFAGVPHLLTPVVTVPKKAASALNWVVREMEMRYETLARSGMRNLEFYNEAVARGAVIRHNDDDPEPHLLPYILVVVDELSDLMMVAPRDVESAICRIAQMARAVGIHLVVATQRPSVDVVTGVIKANIPSRLAFSVASQQDSRVILDQGGADKLIGHGDMLFLHANSSKARRIQGAWVNEKEISAVVAHARRQAEPVYVEGVTVEDAQTMGAAGGSAGDDEHLEEALQLVVRSQLGSTSMLQRKLQVGFARAGRLMDLLEQRGVVGPSQGSKPRDVLMTIEELENRDAGAAPG
ncbi:MAG TPA: DNA translocase FtsK 4TM domain-containing protein [Actinomycetota bacterium]|nr:DNA translocase FtsK 4TM domain-containing protein [Actinomycetota bacterium]